MTVIIIMGPRRPDDDHLSPEPAQQLAGLHVRLEGFPGDTSEVNGLIDAAALRTICQDHLGLRVVSDTDESDVSVSSSTDALMVLMSQDALLRYAEQGVRPAQLPTVVIWREETVELPYSAHRLIDWGKLFNFTPQPVQRNDLAKALVRSLNRWRELQDHPPEPVRPKEPPPSSWPAPVQLWDASKSDIQMEFLLAEGNKVVIRLLERIMVKLSLSYRVARNGQEAVEAYKANPELCRCILMGLAMPVVSGLEATKLIREYEREKELRPAIIIGLKAGHFLDPLYPGFDFNVRRSMSLDQLKNALSSRGIIPG